MKNYDNSFLNDKIKLIAGIDEAGRGPLAGPVVASAVVFQPDTVIEGINDSKKLSETMREKLFAEITSKALAYGIGIIENEEIDEINILQASLKAMSIAVNKLAHKPNLLLIDGNKVFHSGIEARAIVKGDSKSFSIAAASILAKVTRDRIMKERAANHPQYKWDKNKGYPTAEHITAIKRHGCCKYHRKTFLSNILTAEQIELGFAK